MRLKEKYDDQLYGKIRYIQDYGHEKIFPTGPMNIKYITDHVFSQLRILGTDEIKTEVWCSVSTHALSVQLFDTEKFLVTPAKNKIRKGFSTLLLH